MRFRGQGRPAYEAKYLMQPYENGSRMGHHFPITRERAGALGLSLRTRDSIFNVLKPRGINLGRFHELHYRVDPSFFGARLGIGMRPWSGAELGLTRLQGWQRVWHATPGPLKLGIGSAGAGGAALAYWWASNDD